MGVGIDCNLLRFIYSGLMRSNAANQLYLKPSSKQIFYVWSYYRVLHSNTQLSFPWNTIWKPKVPIKVSFFLWSAALGRILTMDNLRILTGVVDLLLAGLVSSTSIDLQRFGPWSLIVSWVIWQEQNACTFEGSERSIYNLKLLFLQTLFEWTNVSGPFNFVSLANLLDCCNFHVL